MVFQLIFVVEAARFPWCFSLLKNPNTQFLMNDDQSPITNPKSKIQNQNSSDCKVDFLFLDTALIAASSAASIKARATLSA